MGKILIISGPTATGKTAFALELCKKLGGEIISADSRQVYRGMDIVTGKDLPLGAKMISSGLIWRDRNLGYYAVSSVPVWLYDVVAPDEPFSLSAWHEIALTLIQAILSRGKLPVIVGGTGLYIKSLTSLLTNISKPPNHSLREKLQGKTASELLTMLNRIDSSRAASLNISDRKNPRRLVRAIELGLAPPSSNPPSPLSGYSITHINLTAPRDYLQARVTARVDSRIQAGAFAEAQKFISRYGFNYPSMTASGYKAFTYPNWKNRWITLENQYVKRQLTWFAKQSDIFKLDISDPNWKQNAEKLLSGLV